MIKKSGLFPKGCDKGKCYFLFKVKGNEKTEIKMEEMGVGG